MDLAALAALEFSPETSEELRGEIGYHAVPAVINLTLKFDYATRDGVQHGAILFMLLKDMCNGQGVEFRAAFNRDFEAEAWENEYDIAWNQNAVKAWHRYWTGFGTSRQLWEERIAIKPREK